MPYTSADIVRMIAQRLGAAGDGQDAEPEDAQKIRAALPSIVADLDARDVACFPDLEAMPNAAVLHLVAIAASALSDEFGLPSDEITLLASRAQGAEQRLRQQRSLPYSGATARVCFF